MEHLNPGNLAAAIGPLVALVLWKFPSLEPYRDHLVAALVVIAGGTISIWDRARMTRRHRRELAKHRKCK